MEANLNQLAEELPEPNPTEDTFTKTVEKYTATLPSSTYLGIAVGLWQFLWPANSGLDEMGELYRSLGPTWLIIGVYNKLVKLEGHDQIDGQRLKRRYVPAIK